MPDGKTHRRVGAIAGAVYAGCRAPTEAATNLWLESFGGAVGGSIGGGLPDLMDPPVSPWHRSLAHGVAPVGLLGVAWMERLEEWRSRLRAEAARCSALKSDATSFARVLWLTLFEWFCRIASGALAGLLAGYVSHLVLDAFTPRSVPVFG